MNNSQIDRAAQQWGVFVFLAKIVIKFDSRFANRCSHA